MDGLAPATLAWCAAALALAGFVKGVIGIGIPLVGVSLLSLMLTVPQAVALLPVPIIVANTWQAIHGGHFLKTCRRFAPLLIAMMIGTVIGGALLSTIDQALLMLIVGAVVLIFAAAELRRFRLRVPVHHHAIAGGVAGFLGGFLGGMSSVFGPPVIMFLTSLELGKEEFVGTISSIYLFAGILLGATLAGFDVAGLDELTWSALATVPLFAGMMVGQLTRRHVSEALFRKVLLIMLVLIGLNMIRRGID